MLYEDYKNWYTLDVEPKKYYAEIAAVQDPDPQATARTRDTGRHDSRLCPRASLQHLGRDQEPLPRVRLSHAAAHGGLHGRRSVLWLGVAIPILPPSLWESRVKVIGVEPDANRLAKAEKYLDQEIAQFDYDAPNVELIHGVPEDLS